MRVALTVGVLLGAACRSVPPRPVVPSSTPRPTPVRVVEPVAVVPVATPGPAPTPTPVPELPPWRPGADREPPLVRVRLERAALPLPVGESGRRVEVETPGGELELSGVLQVSGAQDLLECQVGAFGQSGNAEVAAGRLRQAGLGARLEVGPILTRVVAIGPVGMSPQELAIRIGRAGLIDAGRPIVRGSREFCVQDEAGRRACGSWVRLTPLGEAPLQVGNRSYRGALEIRRTPDGVAVINVLNLEAYVRGVVPAELGPRAFPAVEALKAQAVAARTYTQAHLGEHAAEGWDLCDSMQCQVYEGAGVEHPLSDRAVAETAGQVLTFEGKPIQAFYHSTCAGHTEDAARQFPGAAAPYLRGVACRSERALTLSSAQAPGPWVGSEARLAVVGEALARALEVPPGAAALAAKLCGSEPGAGLGGMLDACGLGDAGVLVRAPGRALDEAGIGELLRVFRLPLAAPGPDLEQDRWELALAVRLGQLVGSVRAVSGRLTPAAGGLRLVKDDGSELLVVPVLPSVLERRGERWRQSFVIAQPGSAATVWCVGDVCPLAEVEPRVTADDASSWSWWRRELSLDDVGRRLKLTGVVAVRVVERGVSGRAVRMAVRHAGGESEMPGLQLRYALELPDSLFVVTPAVVDGQPGVRFLGRGWGHGVGMCQNGAYGLAVGGASYDEILARYYPGTELSTLTKR